MTGKKRILPEVASSSKESDRKNGSFNDTKDDVDEISMPKTSPVKDLKIKKKVKKQKLDPDEIFNGNAPNLQSHLREVQSKVFCSLTESDMQFRNPS
uniref:Uncharacterized protein n=1 Tax=Ditylenchus dipsaci TaxID=166011 RepID=A0A915DIU2_9BILA